jgi:hypothetical protein
MRRMYLFGALCLFLAGCASLPQNTLAVNDIATYKLESVAVSVPPDAHMWWGDAEREFAAKHGEKTLAELRSTKTGAEAAAANANDAIINSPQCKQYLRDEASRRLQGVMQAYVGAELRGNRPVRLEVVVHELTIPSGVQRVVLGGNPMILASATLVDARTGTVIVAYPKLLAMAGAGQGVAGVLVEQFASDDLYDRVIMAYATRYREWLVKT